MRPYTIDRDWRRDFQSVVSNIKRIAHDSNTVQDAETLAVSYIQSLRAAIAELESADWQVAIDQDRQHVQELMLSREICYQCGHGFARTQLFWPDHGRHSDRLMCQPCAQAEDDAWLDVPTQCFKCGRYSKLRDLMRVETSDDYPYAASGNYCDQCREWGLIAHQRTCVLCAVVFRVTNCAGSETVLCPACKTMDALREDKIVRAHLTRARSMGKAATLTLAEWLHAVKDHRGYCAYCRINPYEVLEHFVPLARGGGTTAQNCVPACSSCNTSKGGVDPTGPAPRGIARTDIERVQAYLATR